MRVIPRAAPGVEKLGSVMSDPAGSFNAKAVYGQASRAYEDASSEFWAYLSTRTVDRIGLSPGQRVLDVACGTAPALIAAAERVGPRGRVVGLDYAEEMVALARTKILDRGLDNVEVRVGDMTSVDEVEVAYDAVMCVLGIFFVDDMAGVLRLLAGRARQGGGRVAVTVFGEHFFEPMRGVFVDAVRQVAPHVEVFEPWRRTENEAVLRSIIQAAGIRQVTIFTDDDVLPLQEPNDWWRIVMGSGLRHTVVAIGEEAAGEVRTRCETHILERGITELATRSRYAIATV
jgi:ubiquinone/menaquinone biosynthesis C-methylase UbiE